MKDLFNHIKDRLEDKVPEIKTIRLWNNQFMYSRGQVYYRDSDQNRYFRTEKAFKYPACFIEFVVQDIYNRALGVKDIDLIVRFRLGLEGYKLERFETLDFLDKFTEAIQLMAPPVSVDDQVPGLKFTTFQKVSTEFDNDHDNVEEPYMEYRTLYRSTAGYWYKNLTSKGNVAIDVPVHTTDTIVPTIP